MNETRIDPDYDPSGDQTRDLLRLVRTLVARPQGFTYHEGNGEKRLLAWILGVMSVLTASFILGGVVLYGDVQAIKTGVTGHEQRIQRLEDRDDRRNATTGSARAQP